MGDDGHGSTGDAVAAAAAFRRAWGEASVLEAGLCSRRFLPRSKVDSPTRAVATDPPERSDVVVDGSARGLTSSNAVQRLACVLRRPRMPLRTAERLRSHCGQAQTAIRAMIRDHGPDLHFPGGAEGTRTPDPHTARLAIRSRTRRGADLTAGRPLASATRTAAPWQLDERDPVKAPLPASPAPPARPPAAPKSSQRGCAGAPLAGVRTGYEPTVDDSCQSLITVVIIVCIVAGQGLFVLLSEAEH